MEDAGFDRLTRAFSVTRRGAVKTLFGGLVAGVFGSVGQMETAAKKDKSPKPPKLPKDDPFYWVYGDCKDQKRCGASTECKGGLCYPIACGMNGTIYGAGRPNPQNPCQYCNPEGSIVGWKEWTNRPDGENCANTTGNSCVAEFGQCSGGQCVLPPVPGGSECGDGQVCCAGGCCDAGSYCGSAGACEPIVFDPPDGGGDDDDDPPPDDPDPCPSGDCGSEEPICTIGGIDYQNGDPNPDMDCQFCDAATRPAGWTFTADNTACGEASDRYCCQGICCTPFNCCNPVGLCTSMADFACPELVQ